MVGRRRRLTPAERSDPLAPARTTGLNRYVRDVPYGSRMPGGHLRAVRSAVAMRRRSSRSSSKTAFSVLDVETTGLDPCVDRILEVAIVQMRDHAGSWTSSVRSPPCRWSAHARCTGSRRHGWSARPRCLRATSVMPRVAGTRARRKPRRSHPPGSSANELRLLSAVGPRPAHTPLPGRPPRGFRVVECVHRARGIPFAYTLTLEEGPACNGGVATDVRLRIAQATTSAAAPIVTRCRA